MVSPPPNSATPNGWRRRSAALRLPVDSASPPNCLATSGGQRRSRPTTLRFPADSASPPSSPATPADVVDTTRQLFDPPADAGLIVAGCTRGASIRATGALRLASAPPNSALPAARQMVRGVFPSASGHGNKSPSRIPQEASDRKKDTSRQYISAMYSNKANHGKN